MQEPRVIPRILDILQSGAETTTQLLDIFTSGYGGSYRKARAYAREPLHFKTDWAEGYRDRQRFYSILNKLKREGLIRKDGPKRQSRWFLTRAGTKKWELIRNKGMEQENLNDGLLRIATFDVPEKERPKRLWLVSALRNNKFKMLQKSVWVGKGGLPENFFLTLKQKKMTDYIHIFEISKTGTLHEVV